jgi:hypothetical protein
VDINLNIRICVDPATEANLSGIAISLTQIASLLANSAKATRLVLTLGNPEKQ